MSIANVSLTNTFDEWRTITNQVVTFVNDFESINLRATADKTNVTFAQSNSIYGLVNVAWAQANSSYAYANLVHDQANTAYNHANVTYAQANTSRNHANAAFAQANTARTHANAAFLAANNAVTDYSPALIQANTARSHANVSFEQANTARTHANNAYAKANLAFPLTAGSGAELSGSIYLRTSSPSLYLLDSDVNHANMRINNNANNLYFLVDSNNDGTYEATALHISYEQSAAFLFGNTIYHTGNDGPGTGMNADLLDGFDSTYFASNANLGNAYGQANTARNHANAAFFAANNAVTDFSPAFLQANTARSHANAAFAKANTIGTLGTQASGAVSISGGTITGISTLQATSLGLSGDTNNRFSPGVFVMRGSSPTAYFRDTDGNSAMLHNNSNLFYILRGGVDTESWATVNGVWPFVVNLTNNDITCGGNLYVTSDIAAFTSDIRLKTDIRPIENALEKVMQINGIHYVHNELGQSFGLGNKRHVGVIAHEVQAVLPEVVVPAPFDTDEKTGESRSGENYVTVKYDKIVPLLIEAIKELNEKVIMLQNEIAELKK
jgi:hypothetical protein